MERNLLYPTDAGTPQGAICSPAIANMALDGLETRLRTAFPRYVCYVDNNSTPTIAYNLL